MNDLSINTLGNNITTSTTDYIQQSITNRYNDLYYNPAIISSIYDSTTSTCPTKLETDSNELKINIKKFQIKFNFNL